MSSPIIPPGWDDQDKLSYTQEFHRRYDASIQNEVVSRARCCLFVVVTLIMTAVVVTLGIYLAAKCRMTSLDRTVCILSTVSLGIIGLTVSTLGGIYLDLKSYSAARVRESLNTIMALEYAIRQEAESDESEGG